MATTEFESQIIQRVQSWGMGKEWHQVRELLLGLDRYAFVAGGIVRFLHDPHRRETKDIDVYLISPDHQARVKGVLEALDYKQVNATSNADTWVLSHGTTNYYPLPLQVMNPRPRKRWVASGLIPEVLSKFDLNITLAAMTARDQEHYYYSYHSSFLGAFGKFPNIYLANPVHPADTLRRVIGFAGRGWTIPTETWYRLLLLWDAESPEWKAELHQAWEDGDFSDWYEKMLE